MVFHTLAVAVDNNYVIVIGKFGLFVTPSLCTPLVGVCFCYGRMKVPDTARVHLSCMASVHRGLVPARTVRSDCTT